ncbi:MAG: hypothetical protein RBT80_01395 [Candidatus Vecturithrix sp.]|jgi:hypothetical protein|nr:hypothetical protein [Candidatus Vecturithrix sp.]
MRTLWNEGEAEGNRNLRTHSFVIVWGGILWLWLVLLPISSYAWVCKEFEPEDWDESFSQYEGDYHNCPYGYAITIPQGFVGRGEAPSHTEHGVGILLSRSPQGYLWVDGGAASPDGDSPLDEEADKRIEWIENEAQKIVSVQKSYIMLDALPAVRLIIQYICPDDRVMVTDYFFALHGSAFEYTIALSADAVKYEEYKAIIEHIAKTFQLKSCE